MFDHLAGALEKLRGGGGGGGRERWARSTKKLHAQPVIQPEKKYPCTDLPNYFPREKKFVQEISSKETPAWEL